MIKQSLASTACQTLPTSNILLTCAALDGVCILLNALAKACWRVSPVTPPVACPVTLPCPLAVDPSTSALLDLLLPPPALTVEVGGAVGRGRWEGPDTEGGG